MEFKLTHVSKVIWAPGAHMEEYTAIWLNDAKKYSEQITTENRMYYPFGDYDIQLLNKKKHIPTSDVFVTSTFTCHQSINYERDW